MSFYEYLDRTIIYLNLAVGLVQVLNIYTRQTEDYDRKITANFDKQNS